MSEILFFAPYDLQLIPAWFWGGLVFILGLCIGSFLNVVIYRVPHEMSVAWPGSHCPQCEKPIAGYDNIPVLSYLLLGGKCRNCQKPISLIYPTIELLTGLLFLGAFLRFGLLFPPVETWGQLWREGNFVLLPNLVFIAAIIALFFIDYFERILPDVITLPGMVLALLLRAFSFNLVGIDVQTLGWVLGWNNVAWLVNPRVASLVNAVAGLALGAGSLWLIGIGYFRLRRFRLDTVADLGEFLCERCVPGTTVRLRVRRKDRMTTVYVEGGDFSEFTAEELAEMKFQLAEGGSPALRKTVLTGVTAEDITEGGQTGICIADVPKDSIAAEHYQLQNGDVITHANMEGMGLGDVKMMLFVGAFLGWELTLFTLVVSSLLGGLVAVWRVVREGRQALQTSVPYGVMLGAAALLALFYGEQLIERYVQFMIRLQGNVPQ